MTSTHATTRRPRRRISKEAAGELAALRRAAEDARRLAEATGTPFLIWRDGKVVDLNAKVKRGRHRVRRRP